MKNWATLTLQNPFFSKSGIRIETEILDKARKVSNYHFCQSIPKIRYDPQLIGISRSVIQMLDLDYNSILNDQESPYYLSGSKLIAQSKPIAHNYSGHQFGSWAGQLGDGRAHTLGSIKSKKTLYELQLKGSGLTPFSRHADGNSVVSSAVRQFLASELMHGLGIPSTRAASLVFANQPVKRDPFYNGNIKIQKAAIVLRVSQTFLRFGSIQVCLPNGQMHKQNLMQNRKVISPLCDYLIQNFYQDIDKQQSDPYEEMYQRIVSKTAELVAYWQSVGFCHGVLNTDNMSLINLTIDYGPYAFIDYFSKDYISNASDQYERYSYRRQPAVVKWNLEKLAQALDVLVPIKALKSYLSAHFDQIYENKYYSLMSAKLGIQNNKQNCQLINELIEIMHYCGTNFTNFFRIIEDNSKLENQNIETLLSLITSQSCPTQFYLQNLRAFPQLLQANSKKMLQRDSGFNTAFVEEQKQRIHIFQRLSHQSCKQRSQKERQRWAGWLQKYLVSRSQSKSLVINNPKYVLLNYIAKDLTQELINLDHKNQIQLIDKILKVFSNPFHKDQWFEQRYWNNKPKPVKLTCSS